jgi:hypothetical protein
MTAKKIKRSLLLLFILLNTQLFSQQSNKFGLGGTIQQGQFGIMVPVWLGEKFAIVPAFDLKIAQSVATDIGFALAPRFYLQKAQVSPYFGFRIGSLINIPSKDLEVDSKSKFDLLSGLSFGGEYFLSENFSLGVEAQGNFSKSAKESYRFGNPGNWNFNTGTLVSATVYF